MVGEEYDFRNPWINKAPADIKIVIEDNYIDDEHEERVLIPVKITFVYQEIDGRNNVSAYEFKWKGSRRPAQSEDMIDEGIRAMIENYLGKVDFE